MNLLTAPSFGEKHLEGLLLIFVLNVVLYYTFKKYVKTEKQFYLVATILFYVFEILKIGYMIIRDGAFPMNHIPLHLCSLPLYVFPILYFTKSDFWLHKWAKSAGYGVVLIAAITALVIPVNIIGSNEAWFPFDGNYLPLISFIFHGIMIFVTWYMVKRDYITIKPSIILDAIYFTSILMVLALIVNASIGSDYMLLNTGNGSPLNFLRDTSQLVYTLTMIVLGYVLITITFFATMGVMRLYKWVHLQITKIFKK